MFREPICNGYSIFQTLELRWKYKEFVEATGRTNVIIAAYTTTLARLKLYSYLEVLGSRALYADTASVIFKIGDPNLGFGDYLRDLTDEAPEGQITTFVTGGPKNYAYEVTTSKGIKTQCKIRGITLNYRNSLKINFDTVKQRFRTDTNKTTTVFGMRFIIKMFTISIKYADIQYKCDQCGPVFPEKTF